MTKVSDIVSAQCMRVVVLMAGYLEMLSERAKSDDEHGDRGDVPGWVMITMMTSIVVIALLIVFRTAVIDAVTKAFNSIVG